MGFLGKQFGPKVAQESDLFGCQKFINQSYLHTYIIGHYNPSFRIIDLVSHTTYVVCVHYIYKWRGTNSLKSTLNNRFFEKFFHGGFIYALSFFQKSAERKLPKKYFSYFVFDVWLDARTLAFLLLRLYNVIYNHNIDHPIVVRAVKRHNKIKLFKEFGIVHSNFH